MRCTKDGNGHETRYDYDAKGNLLKITPPSQLGPITYTYDTLSRPLSMTDSKGQKRTFTYDTRDRVTKVVFYPAGSTKVQSTVSYAYDADGNLTSRTDLTGTTTYLYDARNLRTDEKFPNATSNRYGYDPAANLASFSDGGGTTAYRYNEVNLLAGLTDPAGQLMGFEYDDDNSRTKVVFPNGVTEAMSYDKAERLTRIRATRGTQVFTDFEYSFAKTTGESDLRQSTVPFGPVSVVTVVHLLSAPALRSMVTSVWASLVSVTVPMRRMLPSAS